MARRFLNKQDAIEYLQSLPFKAVIDIAADALVEQQVKIDKIVLTQEQFNAMFKIKGINENGEPETRGRKRKTEQKLPCQIRQGFLFICRVHF